ncbi:hypothetical protein YASMINEVIRUS_614 [Yasminevirus sp. GU-2018]|uniref:Sphingosine-1-phosphate lyase n=1 Tax=Yasminevirus sp. GU-2018 TaxID=2420051 RepID=A0A5K0U9B4_9VIRU|nr:hypothetical protein YASMINEVIRUS_614 [Yasminevirus sp. GU-2018]
MSVSLFLYSVSHWIPLTVLIVSILVSSVIKITNSDTLLVLSLILTSIFVKYIFSDFVTELIYIFYRSWYDLNCDNHLSVRIKRRAFDILQHLPYVGIYITKKQTKEINKFRESLIQDRFKYAHVDSTNYILADEPETLEKIRQKVDQVNKPHCEITKVSGSIYTDMSSESMMNEIETLTKMIDLKSLWLNPTHPDIWPDLVQTEAELYKMCSDLFHAKTSNCVLTQGGTMSNIEAVYTYRAMFEGRVSRPNIVAPVTAHSSFKKACKILNIQYRMCKVDELTGKADVKAMENLIDQNTILLVASCPSFPYGIIDPINDISKLCRTYNKPLHVDACLGGFQLPFLGTDVEDSIQEVFDFRNDSITSISADLHKFGKMPKGLSMLMFKSYDVRKYLTFVDLNWTGGLYVMADFPGSRSGFLVLLAWCMLKMFGKDNYRKTTKLLIDTRKRVVNSIKENFPEELYVVGDPKLSVFGLRSKKHNIHFIGDVMYKKYGWHFNSLPDGLHMCITENNVHNEKSANEFVKKFIDDLSSTIKYVDEHRSEGQKSSSYKLYCSTQSIPDYADRVTEEIGRVYVAVQNMVDIVNKDNGESIGESKTTSTSGSIDL